MSSLTIKRLFVWVVSMVLGFVIAYLIITVGFDLLPIFTSAQSASATTIANFGTIYFLVTAIPIGLIFVVWLDHFLDTKIMPD